MASTNIKLKRSKLNLDDQKIKDTELNFGEPLFLENENKFTIGKSNVTSAADLPVVKLVDKSIADKGTFYESSDGSLNIINDSKENVLSRIVKKDITVGIGEWVSDTTYETSEFKWRADVAVTGCTANHIPCVYFDVADSLSGNLANFAMSKAGAVAIYAKSRPASDTRIATLELMAQ